MFRKHPYNKATKQFHKLRNLSPDTPKFQETLFEVIRLSKQAIRSNNNDGDAHVLLANAYYLAALMDFPSENYSRYLPLAAAVIYEWQLKPMYTKTQDNGERIFSGVCEALDREIPDWMQLTRISGTMTDLHKNYYSQAIR